MFKRVPQPPVNPALRALEHHDFWPGFVAALAGVILAFCGARHLTGVDTVDGEHRLGNPVGQGLFLRRPAIRDQLAPPPPPQSRGPRRGSRGARPLGQTTGQGDATDVENPGGCRRANALSDLNKINSGHTAWPTCSPWNVPCPIVSSVNRLCSAGSCRAFVPGCRPAFSACGSRRWAGGCMAFPAACSTATPARCPRSPVRWAWRQITPRCCRWSGKCRTC